MLIDSIPICLKFRKDVYKKVWNIFEEIPSMNWGAGIQMKGIQQQQLEPIKNLFLEGSTTYYLSVLLKYE